MTVAYLDTGPLKGLLDAHDQEHERATSLFRRADEVGATFVCPHPVLLELHRLLVYRKAPRSDGGKRAAAALRLLVGSYEVHYPTHAHLEAAIAMLERFDDQKITLTDATVASMASDAGATVATFDRVHFGLLGVEVFGDDLR